MSAIDKIARKMRRRVEQQEAQVDRVKAIYDGANPVQQALIDDKSPYLGGLCPRRSGKSFAATSKALHLGEDKPGARILIVSLTLKSTVENYWSGAPGGLWVQNERYELGIKFNTTHHTWIHSNGSRGLLAGAETKKDIEHLRGAAAEADLVIIDECKSFAPGHLEDLIENVIEPGLMTRNGQLLLIGTPGSIPIGPFFRATCERARLGEGEDARPTCIRYTEKDAPGPAYACIPEEEFDDLYSLHTWTIEDNVAVPGQWLRALATKRRRGWDDQHPSWRREYLGEWVSDTSELVYAYAQSKASNKCWWRPDYSLGITGLNDADGPWHLLLGLDLGFVDDSAMVLVAYSEQLRELRHVYDYKAPGMDAQMFTEEVLQIIDQYGLPEMIVADFGGGGAKMLLEAINQRYGLSIQPADKKSKNDFIELLNGDFISNRVKIIPGSDLEHELCGLQWDLSNDAKHILARTGRLREDPSCPNHLCDALLYVWRFSYHYFSREHDRGLEKGTPEWYQYQEDEEIARAIRRRSSLARDRFSEIAKERPPTREDMSLWRL